MARNDGDIDDYAGGNQDNKHDGVGAHPEIDGVTEMNIKADIRITQPWKLGEGAAPASGFALGANRPG